MKKIKAIILFSGGLDSILAAKILQKQGIKLLGLVFKSYFFNQKQAEKTAQEIKLELKIVDFSEEHLKIVKKPKFGYGRAINPCIDCRILMLKKAKEMFFNVKRSQSIKDENYYRNTEFNFIATGDVLGQRPLSQNRNTLELIENQSLLKGFLLRPLCAKLLKPSIPEKLKWVNRELLLDIQGRSRKRQILLAEKYKIREYANPAGGCILTDLEFGKRLKELLKIYLKCKSNDIELLKLGRHFLQDKTKIVVGRNEAENKKIQELARSKDILVEMKNYTGPLTLIRNYEKTKIKSLVLEKAKKLTQYYSTKARNKEQIKFKNFKSNRRMFL